MFAPQKTTSRRPVSAWLMGLLLLAGCERWDLPRQPTTLNDGLVARYAFDGTTLDASNNHLNGQLINGAAYGLDRTGKPASALVLDGLDDYFDIPDNALLRTETLSISFWMKAQKVTSTCHLYSKSTYFSV